MNRRIAAAAVSTALPLALGIGVTGSYAHGHAHQAPIRGMVTATGQTLQVQTANGAVSIPLTSTTHVLRQASGSTADLTKGTNVDLKVTAGTTTVQAITIFPARSTVVQHAARPHPGTHAGPHTGTHAHTNTSGQHNWTATHTGTHAQRPFHHGQIVSTTNNTISVQERHGTSTTTTVYTLGSGVTITKVMNGTVKDLAVGQTVEVIKDHNGAAAAIDILSS